METDGIGRTAGAEIGTDLSRLIPVSAGSQRFGYWAERANPAFGGADQIKAE